MILNSQLRHSFSYLSTESKTWGLVSSSESSCISSSLPFSLLTPRSALSYLEQGRKRYHGHGRQILQANVTSIVSEKMRSTFTTAMPWTQIQPRYNSYVKKKRFAMSPSPVCGCIGIQGHTRRDSCLMAYVPCYTWIHVHESTETVHSNTPTCGVMQDWKFITIFWLILNNSPTPRYSVIEWVVICQKSSLCTAASRPSVYFYICRMKKAASLSSIYTTNTKVMSSRSQFRASRACTVRSDQVLQVSLSLT